MDLIKLGSKTARSGFKNEDTIVSKFNNWKKDADAKQWLKIMGYALEEIEKVVAIKIHGYKTDVQVQVTIYFKKAIAAENLSIKLVSNPQGFNQIDKRWVDKYVQLWDIPKDVTAALKLFTGEIRPSQKGLRDRRRVFMDEFDSKTQKDIVHFFSENKFLVVSDILKGRGKLSAGWMLVALTKSIHDRLWVLKSINHVMNVFGSGAVVITDRGSLKIGRITMQRKGGDAGRPTSRMLQFKINPILLFNDEWAKKLAKNKEAE